MSPIAPRCHIDGPRRAAAAALLALFIATCAAGPGRAGEKADVGKEVSEALGAIGSYSADKRDEALAAGRSLIDRLSGRIATIEEKAKETSGEASEATREKWQDTKSGLRNLHDEAATKLDRMKDSSAETWSDARQSFADSIKSLGESIEKADD